MATKQVSIRLSNATCNELLKIAETANIDVAKTIKYLTLIGLEAFQEKGKEAFNPRFWANGADEVKLRDQLQNKLVFDKGNKIEEEEFMNDLDEMYEEK